MDRRDYPPETPAVHPLILPAPPIAGGELVRVVDVSMSDTNGHRVPVITTLPSQSRWLAFAGWALFALASVAAFAGVVWVAVQAVAELVALGRAVWAWAETNWGWLVAGAVAVWLLPVRLTGSPCPGLHCGGCGG